MVFVGKGSSSPKTLFFNTSSNYDGKYKINKGEMELCQQDELCRTLAQILKGNQVDNMWLINKWFNNLI